MRRGTLRQSLSLHSQNFVRWAWKEREHLGPDERSGFVQFFYIMLCCHFENFLKDQIRVRLNSIKSTQVDVKLPPYNVNGRVLQVEYAPISESVSSIASALEKDIEKFSFSRLGDVYDSVFNKKIKAVIGGSLYENLKSISDLRNSFAHGADFVKEYIDGRLVEKNLLLTVLKRLNGSGVVSLPSFQNVDQFNLMEIIGSDKVMRHFYHATKDAVDKLKGSCDFHEEELRSFRVDLPPLS